MAGIEPVFQQFTGDFAHFCGPFKTFVTVLVTSPQLLVMHSFMHTSPESELKL
jgi:hypothetical protein